MKTFFKSLAGVSTSILVVALVVLGLPKITFASSLDYKVYMQIGISVVALIVCFYIVLSKKYAEDTLKWAFGTIGLIIGYWLPTVV